MAHEASKVSRVLRVSQDLSASEVLVVVVTLAHKAHRELRDPRVTRDPLVLVLVAQQDLWVARASVASLARVDPRAMPVRQELKDLQARMGSRVTAVTLVPWDAPGFAASRAIRVCRAPKAILATLVLRVRRVMLAFVAHVVMLVKSGNPERPVLMAPEGRLEVSVVVELREILAPRVPRVRSATRGSRARVAFVALLVSSARRVSVANEVLVATREPSA